MIVPSEENASNARSRLIFPNCFSLLLFAIKYHFINLTVYECTFDIQNGYFLWNRNTYSYELKKEKRTVIPIGMFDYYIELVLL